VESGEKEARRILTEKNEELHILAKALLEYETLSGDEIINALKGVPPVRDDADAKRPTGPSVAVPISPARPEPA
jgi:cell division protease FtsH